MPGGPARRDGDAPAPAPARARAAAGAARAAGSGGLRARRAAGDPRRDRLLPAPPRRGPRPRLAGRAAPPLRRRRARDPGRAGRERATGGGHTGPARLAVLRAPSPTRPRRCGRCGRGACAWWWCPTGTSPCTRPWRAPGSRRSSTGPSPRRSWAPPSRTRRSSTTPSPWPAFPPGTRSTSATARSSTWPARAPPASRPRCWSAAARRLQRGADAALAARGGAASHLSGGAPGRRTLGGMASLPPSRYAYPHPGAPPERPELPEGAPAASLPAGRHGRPSWRCSPGWPARSSGRSSSG